VTNDQFEWFDFQREADCPGPHDHQAGTHRYDLRINVAQEDLNLSAMLTASGADIRYADRLLAWTWECPGCGRSSHQLHVIRPRLRCAKCGGQMTPGFEQVTGLSAQDLERLSGPAGVPTLEQVGLGHERVIRCTAGTGDLLWVHVGGGHESAN
jgi:hypothetical protein